MRTKFHKNRYFKIIFDNASFIEEISKDHNYYYTTTIKNNNNNNQVNFMKN